MKIKIYIKKRMREMRWGDLMNDFDNIHPKCTEM